MCNIDIGWGVDMSNWVLLGHGWNENVRLQKGLSDTKKLYEIPKEFMIMMI